MEGLASRLVFLKTSVLKETEGPNAHKPHMLRLATQIPGPGLLPPREAGVPGRRRAFPGLRPTHLPLPGRCFVKLAPCKPWRQGLRVGASQMGLAERP